MVKSCPRHNHFYPKCITVSIVYMFISIAFKIEITTLLIKAFKIADKSQNQIRSISKAIVYHQQGESPINNISQYLVSKLLMIERQQWLGESMNLVITFLTGHGIMFSGKIKGQLQMLFERIKAYNEGAGRQIENVVSIYYGDLASQDCICGKNSHQNYKQKEEMCYKCGKLCHTSCCWERQITQSYFQCPHCFLSNCLPQQPVRHVLFSGYLRYSIKEEIQYKMKFHCQPKELKEENIQIRCCRLNKSNRFEIVFPESCTLHLSKHKLAQFKPLANNSSLKRRNDEVVTIEKHFLHEINSLSVIESKTYLPGTRPTPSDHHFLMIVGVCPLPRLKLQKKLLENRLAIEQSKQFLKEYIKKEGDLNIEKLNINMKCPYFNTIITYPARSIHCSTHYQPFDLINFIVASANSKSSSRKWHCPICKKRAYDVLIDDYLFQIIDDKDDIVNIAFDNQGKLLYIEHSNIHIHKEYQEYILDYSDQKTPNELTFHQPNKHTNTAVNSSLQATQMKVEDQALCIVDIDQQQLPVSNDSPAKRKPRFNLQKEVKSSKKVFTQFGLRSGLNGMQEQRKLVLSGVEWGGKRLNYE